MITAEHNQFPIVHDDRMTASAHRHLARRLGHMPHGRFQIEVHNSLAVKLVLRVIRTVPVTATAKHIHPIVEHGRRVKVTIAGRFTARLDKRPRHRLQIQTVDVPRKLINLLLEATKYVHAMADHARRMAIAHSGHATVHRWLHPAQSARVKRKQHVAAHLIVATAPNVHQVLVQHRRVAVPLERHLRIDPAAFQRVRLHLRPAQRVRVQHLHVDRVQRTIVLAAAVAPERENQVVDHDGGVVDATRAALDVGDPVHFMGGGSACGGTEI